MDTRAVTVIGGGLAGSEAAWRLAQGGVAVELVEMKPARRSPAHVLDGLAELVCSNSLRSDNPQNAVGLLHEELRRLGSLVLSAADETRVPAGDALAVDRERFSALVTGRLRAHPLVRVRRGGGAAPPRGTRARARRDRARSPATRSRRRSRRSRAGGSTSTTRIAPIVTADSIDMAIAYARSRYGKGAGDDYLNLPLDEAQYRAFVEALLAGEKVPAARLRGAALLRGLPPDRGDGGARRRTCSRTAP